MPHHSRVDVGSSPLCRTDDLAVMHRRTRRRAPIELIYVCRLMAPDNGWHAQRQVLRASPTCGCHHAPRASAERRCAAPAAVLRLTVEEASNKRVLEHEEPLKQLDDHIPQARARSDMSAHSRGPSSNE